MADAPQFRVAYDEAVRALRAQADAHSGLRQRASTVLATSLVVTSFFGGQAVARGAAPTALGWLAVGAFVVAGALSLCVLFPTDLSFTPELGELLALVEASPGDPYRELSHRLAGRHRENTRHIVWMQRVFRGGAVALLAEAVLWIAYLAES
jgi:hypothetical protein